MAQGYGQSPPVGALSPSEAASKVELSISCGNLKDLDHFSRSDPCVFVLEQRGRDWVKLGRTEVIDNNLNPKVRLQARWTSCGSAMPVHHDSGYYI